MKKAILSTLVGLAFATTATATTTTTTKSEVWFQPGAGKAAFDIGVSSTPTTLKYDNSGTTGEAKTTGTPVKFKYTQGITETMSWNVNSDFGTEETTAAGKTFKTSGLGNINAGLLVNQNEWYYGADASLSLAKKKEATETVTGTRVTGGHSLTPFGGYHHAAMGIGARVSYAYMLDQTADNEGSDEVTSGGNTIAVTPYWETQYVSGLFGAKLSYAQVASSKEKTNTGTTDTTAHTTTSLGAYVAHDLAANGTILANIDMTSISAFESDTTKFTSGSSTNISVGYRMGF